jgi:hypothetical protein
MHFARWRRFKYLGILDIQHHTRGEGREGLAPSVGVRATPPPWYQSHRQLSAPRNGSDKVWRKTSRPPGIKTRCCNPWRATAPTVQSSVTKGLLNYGNYELSKRHPRIVTLCHLATVARHCSYEQLEVDAQRQIKSRDASHL